VGGSKEALTCKGRIESLRSGSEGGAEGIVYGLEDVTTVALYSLAEKSIVQGNSRLHGTRVLFPAPGASLYIGEEESDRPCGRWDGGWRGYGTVQ
jgi:hypothetical protein